MCGISGYLKKGPTAAASNIIKMNGAIRHRGPDDEGFVLLQDRKYLAFGSDDSMPEIKASMPLISSDFHSNLALGFRRLSILDLSEMGHQPMLEGPVCICFNGEIYNFKQVRKELQSMGQHFKSESDSEVVLKAYLQWGIAFVDRLNGMFAIAIVDLSCNKIFLIRDRLGIKPLFYHRSASDISWCSEIKGLLKLDWVNPEMSTDGLVLNYQFKSSPAPSTCFQNIYSIAPGSFLTIDMETLSSEERRYWEIPLGALEDNISEEESVERVREKLSEIAGAQMQSDVPLISMMSGGVDSTLITALAHEQDKSMACYTLSIDGSGSGLDELPQATRMANRLGLQQFVHHLSEEDIVENALHFQKHIEEPYNSLDVVFNASKHLQSLGYKVILSGNGADEVFGGYAYNLNLPKWRKLRRFYFLAPFLLNGEAKMQKLKYFLSLKNVGEYFLSTTGGLRDYSVHELLKDLSMKEIKELTKPFVEEHKFKNDYEGLFYYDLKYSVGGHHVYHDDICAMRYSVEMRYPYLDHELIELVAALPLAYRFNGFENKPLLRKVAQPYIGAENLKMPKKGFNIPLNQAIEQSKAVQDFVAKNIAYLKSTGRFNNAAIDQTYALGKQKNYYLHTWQLVSTAIWMQEYL